MIYWYIYNTHRIYRTAGTAGIASVDYLISNPGFSESGLLIKQMSNMIRAQGRW